jgi:hypothetical protein
MPEQSKFLQRIVSDKEDSRGFTAERQLTEQAFDLDVETRDGLQSEGFPWSHYSGRWWSGRQDLERLVIFFGERAVDIRGLNLKPVIEQIREGRLRGVKEMLTARAELMRAEGSTEAIISSVKCRDAEEVFKEIYGDQHDTGYAGKVRGR